jgi:predicted nuclease of predicted toxin-antitoxin system
MRILADENFPRLIVEAVRAAGHDVAWIRAEAPGSPDERVLALARTDHRVVLTFDKDFGELALKRGLAGSRGIILFRLPSGRPAEVTTRIVTAISSREDREGHFSVVEEKRVRMRKLRA